MINHFRTLILNEAPVPAPKFGYYVPSGFEPIRAGGIESAIRSVLLNNMSTRPHREFMATVLYRLIHDFKETRKIELEIDDRLTFNPNTPLTGAILDPDAPSIPKLSEIWTAVSEVKGLRSLFTSTGEHSETLTDLWKLLSETRRDDHRVAIVLCALCLKLDEEFDD